MKKSTVQWYVSFSKYSSVSHLESLVASLRCATLVTSADTELLFFVNLLTLLATYWSVTQVTSELPWSLSLSFYTVIWWRLFKVINTYSMCSSMELQTQRWTLRTSVELRQWKLSCVEKYNLCWNLTWLGACLKILISRLWSSTWLVTTSYFDSIVHFKINTVIWFKSRTVILTDILW